MISCPNKNLPEWKELLKEVGKDRAYLEWNVRYNDTWNNNQVNTTLKSINILQTDKAKQAFAKGEKNNWDLNKILTELQIPKEQKQLILDLGKTNREEIITDLLANYSYTIEVNTAKVSTYDETDIDMFDPGSKKEATKTENSQHYSNLTVPGGTNYTENEIATPVITPSIKGHAEFSTDNGIGWFRSDEQTKVINDENADLKAEIQGGKPEDYITYGLTKTRRILEVQSDLFQKGRDKGDLLQTIQTRPDVIDKTILNKINEKIEEDDTGFGIGNEITIDGVTYERNVSNGKWRYKEFQNVRGNESQNQFLQLLNKNNNWVTFFIKSIIQDSAKKGYEKVLFPTGDTASKVEGHTTLEEFKKQNEDRIKEIESGEDYYSSLSPSKKIHYKGKYGRITELRKEFPELKNLKGLGVDRNGNLIPEIVQLKQELERIETEGFGALKPIYNFYENTVTNILKKQGYNPELITDDFGNTWNEVQITKDALNTILLQKVDPVVAHKDYKKEFGFTHRKGVSQASIISLKSKLSQINNRNKANGKNVVYKLINLEQTGQADMYNYDIVKLIGELNVEEKAKRLERKGKLSQAERTRRLGEDNQLSLFQKTEAIANELLDLEYQREYGINFHESYETLDLLTEDLPNKAQRQIEVLSKKFKNTRVVFDSSLTASGKVEYTSNGVVLSINPNYLQNDTVAHEFAHIFIDVIGLDNMRIKAALNKLEGTELEQQVRDQYPELSGDNFKRELLATAIGKEANKIFENSVNQSWWSRFKDWFFEMLGIKAKNFEIVQIAKELWETSSVDALNAEVYQLPNLNIEVFQKFDQATQKIKEVNIKTTLEKLKNRLQVQRTKYDKSSKRGADAFKENIDNAIEEINNYLEKENAQGLVNIINHVNNQYISIRKKLSKGDVGTGTLNTINSFIQSFDELSTINTILYDHLNNIKAEEILVNTSDEVIKELRSVILDMVSQKEAIKDKILTSAKEVLARKWSKLATRVRRKYEILKEREVKEQNPNISKDELNKIIQDHIEKNKDNIEQEEYQYIYNNLNEGVDIGGISRLLDSGMVNSSLIGISAKFIDKADMMLRSYTMNSAIEIKELSDRFNKLNNSTNQETKFKDILEITENADYLISEYKGEFYEEYQKQKSLIWEARKKHGADSKEYKAAQSKWAKWTKANFTTEGQGNSLIYKPIDKWKNKPLPPEYQEIVNDIKKKIEKADKKVNFKRDKLIKELPGLKFYRLPQAHKSLTERVYEQKPGEIIKNTIQDSVFKRATDLEYEQEGQRINGINESLNEKTIFNYGAFANEADEIELNVPIYYRNTIDSNDRSRDVFTLLYLNEWTTENYHQKNHLSADLDLLLDVIQHKKYIANKKGNILVNKLSNLFSPTKEKEGPQSNEYQMLKSVVENRIYGVGEIERTLSGDVTVNKVADILNSWSASVMLGFNYFAAVPNFLMGSAMNFSEAMGGLYYNSSDFRKAQGQYWKDSHKSMSDFNKSVVTSKTNVLLNYFDVLSDPKAIKTKFVNDGSYRNMFQKDNMFVLSHGVEHYIQATQMYAVLNNIKHNGESIADLMYVDDKGNLKFKKAIPENILLSAREKIKKVVADSHGQYDDRMKSMVQREWYGKMAFMFRKWLPRGTTRRWRGLGNIFKDYADFENKNDFDIFYSEEAGQYEEGAYVSFLRFMMKDFKKFKFAYLKKFNTLTDYEKANVRKTITELSAAVMTYTAFLLINGMAKEEDDEEMKDLFYMQAYWFRRTYGELTYWGNPLEAISLTRTPAASISMVEKQFKFLEQLVLWEKYERKYGDYEAGDYKIQKRFKDITPIYSQVLRYKNPQEALSFLTK